jgi:hypothetical protein
MSKLTGWSYGHRYGESFRFSNPSRPLRLLEVDYGFGTICEAEELFGANNAFIPPIAGSKDLHSFVHLL